MKSDQFDGKSCILEKIKIKSYFPKSQNGRNIYRTLLNIIKIIFTLKHRQKIILESAHLHKKSLRYILIISKNQNSEFQILRQDFNNFRFTFFMYHHGYMSMSSWKNWNGSETDTINVYIIICNNYITNSPLFKD